MGELKFLSLAGSISSKIPSISKSKYMFFQLEIFLFFLFFNRTE